MELDESVLEAAATGASFTRGEDYVRYVRGLRVDGARATATIQARNVYLVDLAWPGTELVGSCTCPHHAQGAFCKHLVAVGLAALGRVGPSLPSVAQLRDEIAELVAALPEEAVREVLTAAAQRDGSVRRELELRRSLDGGDTSAMEDELKAAAKAALSPRGFIDYRRSFEVAADIESVLDEFERCIDLGVAAAVVTPARYATERLRTVIGQADDSGGALGDACHRAAELHARACREAPPDQAALGRWLARFRAASPGWPDLHLEDHVEALGEKGLAAYRRAVARVATSADRDEFEVRQMQLELADHDGDVDAAIALLDRGERTAWGGIVQRLRAAGREREAMAWTDRAVQAGRVSSRGGRNEFWLDPDEVAGWYLDDGREEDAIAVLRAAFRQQPGAATAKRLVTVAQDLGRAEEERAWVAAVAQQRAEAPYGDGAVLVELALADGDLDRAWQAAQAHGAGSQWERLAAALATERPAAAVQLHRAQVERDLTAGADTRLYPGIARRLALLRTLHERAGTEAAFERDLTAIRSEYGRRPSLMTALDKQGLVATPSDESV
jgi:hypothetical protein